MGPVAGACLVVLSGVAGLLARARAPFSDDELGAATRSVDAARARLRHLTSLRPTRVEAAGSTRVSLAALLDLGGANGECLRAAASDDVVDALQGVVRTPDGRRRRWGFDVPRIRGWSPPGALRVIVSAQHPPFPDREEPEPYRRVRAACGGLAATVAALADAERQGSPYPFDSQGWLDPHLQVLHLGRAISIVARGRARARDLDGALTLLVQGAAVLQDVRRGPTSLMTATLSRVAERGLWSTFASLLIPDPGPSALLRAKLGELLDRLMEAWPHPHDVLLADATGISELARAEATGAENRAFALMAPVELVRRVDRWCPRDRDPGACFSSWSRRRSRNVEPGVLLRAWHFVAGPNARLRRDLSVQLAAHERTYRLSYLRLLSSSVSLRIMKVLLALSEARQAQICPTRAHLDPRLLTIPFATGPIEVTRFSGPQYEITAPRLRIDPGYEREVFYAICPAVGGRWREVDESPSTAYGEAR